MVEEIGASSLDPRGVFPHDCSIRSETSSGGGHSRFEDPFAFDHVAVFLLKNGIGADHDGPDTASDSLLRPLR